MGSSSYGHSFLHRVAPRRAVYRFRNAKNLQVAGVLHSLFDFSRGKSYIVGSFDLTRTSTCPYSKVHTGPLQRYFCWPIKSRRQFTVHPLCHRQRFAHLGHLEMIPVLGRPQLEAWLGLFVDRSQQKKTSGSDLATTHQNMPPCTARHTPPGRAAQGTDRDACGRGLCFLPRQRVYCVISRYTFKCKFTRNNINIPTCSFQRFSTMYVSYNTDYYGGP